MWTTFKATVIKEENGFYLVRLYDGTELTAKRSDRYQKVEIGKTMVCRSRQGFNYITRESVVNLKWGEPPVLSMRDYENTSISITPAERQELLGIFEFRTKSCPPVLWTKFFDFRKKLQAPTTTLTLTPDEWQEITHFLEYRREQYPCAYRKKDATIMAKLQANPPTPRNTAI